MKCSRCQAENNTKAGIVHSKQRYKCKDCGCLLHRREKINKKA